MLAAHFAYSAFVAAVLYRHDRDLAALTLNISSSYYSQAVGLLRQLIAYEEVLPERLKTGQKSSA